MTSAGNHQWADRIMVPYEGETVTSKMKWQISFAERSVVQWQEASDTLPALSGRDRKRCVIATAAGGD